MAVAGSRWGNFRRSDLHSLHVYQCDWLQLRFFLIRHECNPHTQTRVLVFGTLLTFACKPMFALLSSVYGVFGVTACLYW